MSKSSTQLKTTSARTTNVPATTSIREIENIIAASELADPFLAASASYANAKKKTPALRRLWDLALEMGKAAGREEMRGGYERGLMEGAAEERQLQETAGTSSWGGSESELEKLQAAHADGVSLGMATGRMRGIKEERKRWKDLGHAEDSPCATTTVKTTSHASTATDPSVPITFVDIGIETSLSSQLAIHTSIGTTTEDISPEPPSSTARTQLPAKNSFDWADDAASIPIHTISPVSPLSPRDLSDLRSGIPRPFGSLQQRLHRARGTSSRRTTRHNPQRSTYTFHSTTRRHPPAIPPHPHTTFSSGLDWGRDPRLFDLSHALEALGWVRPG